LTWSPTDRNRLLSASSHRCVVVTTQTSDLLRASATSLRASSSTGLARRQGKRNASPSSNWKPNPSQNRRRQTALRRLRAAFLFRTDAVLCPIRNNRKLCLLTQPEILDPVTAEVELTIN